MQLSEPIASVWSARLALEFARRERGTVLARSEHYGPLRIQKPLYPEGPDICHAIVLHPPAGIVGGDELAINVQLDAGAHALLTTPGAGKWYRSAGAWATQQLNFKLASGSVLEWLPQETIVFNGACADMQTQVELAQGAIFIGQEILCLGRRAAKETFDQGELRLATSIRLHTDDGTTPLWYERGHLSGDSPLLTATSGLAGSSVCGTLLAAGHMIPPELLNACRSIVPTETDAQYGVTALPQLFVARYLGHSAEGARAWFASLWSELRPALLGRPAQTPRIWNT